MNEQVKIGVKNDATPAPVQAPSSISISRPPMPGSSPKHEGINLMGAVNNIEDVRAKLRAMGIELGKIFYFVYSDGTTGAALFYCKTVHGQYVLVKPPMNTKLTGGDLSLNIQRVGILPSNIISSYANLLNGIYTGHAFVASGGIHLVERGQLEAVVYGYDDYVTARNIFDVKKHHYLILPFISFEHLIEPARLNTLEAYISVHDKGLMKPVIEKAGLSSFLTMSGPFTVFMPSDERLDELRNQDPERLRAIILAGIVSGNLANGIKTGPNAVNGSILTDRNSVSTLGSETLQVKALGQNDLTVSKINGAVVSVSAGGKTFKVKAGKPVRKYNGTLYRIDGILTPLSYSFQLPARSDFDDVVTIFDINKSTLEIRRAQYSLNLKEQTEMFDLLSHINRISGTLMQELTAKAQQDGAELIDRSNRLMNLFYSRDVPCDDRCAELDQLAEEVARRNESYENLIRVSTRFSSLKVPLEMLYLKLARTDQRFHVPNAIEHISVEDHQ